MGENCLVINKDMTKDHIKMNKQEHPNRLVFIQYKTIEISFVGDIFLLGFFFS